MTTAQIQATYKSVLSFLLLGQVKNALGKLKLFIDELQIGEYADKHEELSQNYKYLLQYYVNGVEDPQRKSVYNKIIAKTCL